MNILILDDGLATYELAKCASQSPLVKTIFVLSADDKMMVIDKVNSLNIAKDDTQEIENVIRDKPIDLCINNAASSKAIFEHHLALTPPAIEPSTQAHQSSLSYADSGVSIDEGNDFVEHIKKISATNLSSRNGYFFWWI